MTDLLKKAFEEAAKLPPREQDALASVLLQELNDENRWEATLERSHDALASLADAALAEHRSGDSQPLDPDAL
jgi:hypothetical protein